jgi:hypothetical protein
LLELAHRIQLLDCHPWYNRETFEPEQFEIWRASEYDTLKKIMQEFIFGTGFIGLVRVKVKEAKNLAPQNNNGTADTFCTIQIEGNDKRLFKTKIQK